LRSQVQRALFDELAGVGLKFEEGIDFAPEIGIAGTSAINKRATLDQRKFQRRFYDFSGSLRFVAHQILAQRSQRTRRSPLVHYRCLPL
jgi:hypothetical protein